MNAGTCTVTATTADFKAATGDNAILVKQLTAASVTGTTLNLDFGDGEASGIVNMNRETITNNRYYDLQGRRVNNVTKKRLTY